MSDSHTFYYEDAEDFITQMDTLLTKLRYTRMTPYQDVRLRYPQLSATAFYNRLNRFRGEYPRQMSPSGKRTEKLFVTSELDAHLRK